MSGAGESLEDWIEYQDNEIQGAKENLQDRLNHIQSDAVVSGVLDGENIQGHGNERLEAYLEGYVDALGYSVECVERIDNLVKYVENHIDREDEGE